MNDRFLKACRGEAVDATPIWIMRQAGRYLPDYMRVREKVTFLELTKTPELAARVTVQPVDVLGVDAAILFSDILTPVEPMGLKLDFVPGPVFDNPVRSMADVERLCPIDPQTDVPFVLETIRILRRVLANRVPLIGFAGAPFTLACYMVEGKGSRDFALVKRMMYAEPAVFDALMDRVTSMDLAYLSAQAAAGAQALQIFDTWGGILSPADYARYALPWSRRLIDGLKSAGVPVIHFVKGSGAMLEMVAQAGGDVIGLDWHVDLGRARDALGSRFAVQGNLDPTVLFGSHEFIAGEVRRILDENAGRPGHVFNLGHGILPTTPWENARALVEMVHEFSSATA